MLLFSSSRQLYYKVELFYKNNWFNGWEKILFPFSSIMS